MIVLVVVTEKNPRTGRLESIVSHGVDFDTGNNVVLPGSSPQSLGAVWNSDLNEYTLP